MSLIEVQGMPTVGQLVGYGHQVESAFPYLLHKLTCPESVMPDKAPFRGILNESLASKKH